MRQAERAVVEQGRTCFTRHIAVTQTRTSYDIARYRAGHGGRSIPRLDLYLKVFYLIGGANYAASGMRSR